MRAGTRPIQASISMPLRIVADGVNRLRAADRGMIVITHYQRLLDYIVPDVVHVLSAGPHREGPAARSWRSNSKRQATRNIRTKRRDPMNAEIRPVKTAAEIGFADLFAAARQSLPGGESTEALRRDAFDRFVGQWLPNSRVEA